MTRTFLAASVLATLAAASPAFAQGNSQQHRKNPGNAGNSANAGKPGNAGVGVSAPPSRNDLAVPTVVSPPASPGATPLAWIDDASLLAPGSVYLSMSALRWSGGGASEVDFPIVDAAIGLAPRLQLSASVPRVVGSPDPEGAVGGVGTSFFSAKVGVYELADRGVKVAVTPTMQLLGEGVVAALEPGQGRVRWGLPVSAEISRGTTRLYGGGGYFSPGLWFAGAAVGARASEKVFVSAGFSRAWRGDEGFDVPLSERDRKELSGGAAYVLTPNVTLFGSVGRTVKTLVENGAGTSIVGGVSFSLAPTIQ